MLLLVMLATGGGIRDRVSILDTRQLIPESRTQIRSRDVRTKGTGMSVAGRDPRYRYCVQSTKPALEGKLGTTFSLSNGVLGIRGAHEECPAWGRAEFYVAGTYASGPPSLLGFHDPDHILTHPERITPEALAEVQHDAIQTLPNLPFPIGLQVRVDGVLFSLDNHTILSVERMLEMDNAVMRRCLVFRDEQGRRTRIDSCRFVSAADPNVICLRADVRRLNHSAPVRLQGFLHEDVANTNDVRLWKAGDRLDQPNARGIECVPDGTDIRVAIVQHQKVTETDDGAVIELSAVAGAMSLAQAEEKAGVASTQGFDACREEHCRQYRADVRRARVEFDGNPATVQGFNFGQMHMQMAIGPAVGKAGLPIKGLTGHGYRFLTFWDMDFHMFPYYVLTRPEEARLLLEYRYGQLDQYRENAASWGAKGAQVPWETGTRGVEETAPWLCLQDREIHISADAAMMFVRYAEVTGDEEVMQDMGFEFVCETARFYASRLRWNEEAQHYDLPDIGCPDQYHTFADNDVFISLMARWNIQCAATLCADSRYADLCRNLGIEPVEVEQWQKMVDLLFVHGPNSDGIIEQCDGFLDLDENLEGICETYCSHSQAVKQPDVLAAFIPFEDQYDIETRRKNWHFYNARTLHGSSLSLPGMAYAAARCGLNDEALHNLHASCRMDLDDVNLDSERGVHISGGAVEWCTVVHGFGGVDVTGQGVSISPNLPRQWSRLACTVHWHFQQVDIEITREMITVTIGRRNESVVPVCIKGQWRSINPGDTHEEGR